jgi:hypothetical protein
MSVAAIRRATRGLDRSPARGPAAGTVFEGSSLREYMLDWIVIGVLYAVSFGLLALLGGLSAAGEAFRQWSERRSCVGDC